ncbi:hypothetical protein [Nitrosopumilus spindle-shaped virus]|uniref:Uncharacterized protein n=1 Tax=Nitrosopumilus spindle-shaped virus TaxID=2508184 RepID=A0A514K581_9VIRU|nr:hypothetical protein [Nitrosopumilus spindle-shaped virus]
MSEMVMRISRNCDLYIRTNISPFDDNLEEVDLELRLVNQSNGKEKICKFHIKDLEKIDLAIKFYLDLIKSVRDSIK